MTTYDDLMPNCHGCPYWEIACCIDNKLGLCSMCKLEMKKQEKKNEVFELYDIECNTCKYYDPMNGICQITGNNQHGYDFCEAMDTELNPMWEEWEET